MEGNRLQSILKLLHYYFKHNEIEVHCCIAHGKMLTAENRELSFVHLQGHKNNSVTVLSNMSNNPWKSVFRGSVRF